MSRVRGQGQRAVGGAAVLVAALLCGGPLAWAQEGGKPEMDCRNGCSADSLHGDHKFLADEMPSGDLCTHHVRMAYAQWAVYQVLWWTYWNTEIDPVLPTIKDLYRNADLLYDDGSLEDDAHCNAEESLELYASNLVWEQDTGLRETETAVLKRCRSLPRRALERKHSDLLCETQDYAALAEQRLGQMKGVNLGPAARRFLDLLAQSKGGTAISQGVMAEAYWAAVDEFNNSDVRAEIEAARKQQEQ